MLIRAAGRWLRTSRTPRAHPSLCFSTTSSTPEPKHSKQDHEIWLVKRLSYTGTCSRRAALRALAEGLVTVNGETVRSNVGVSDTDLVRLEGRRVPSLGETVPRLWLYHKPRGELVTNDDPSGRPTIFNTLRRRHGAAFSSTRPVAVGRLDMPSQGLLLLTNSPVLATFLEHPRNGTRLPRTYHVCTNYPPTASQLEYMQRGVTLVGDKLRLAPIECRVLEDKPDSRGRSWVEMTLTEGKNREIRKVLEQFRLSVYTLERVKFGPFQLGNLQSRDLLEVNIPAGWVDEANGFVSELGVETTARSAEGGSRRRRRTRTNVNHNNRSAHTRSRTRTTRRPPPTSNNK